MTAGETERIDFIQALRGIAAMAVVLFHVRFWISGPAFDDVGHRLFENGNAGVDLFFIVSGFIMVHATWRLRGGRRDAIRFLAKRVARIWPVYVVTTVVFVIVEDNFFHWFASARGLAGIGKAFVFYPVDPTPPFFGYTPNGVGWTLDYEMWFYVLFAVALLFAKHRWLVLCALFAGCLVALPLALGDQPPSLNAYTNYGMSNGLLNLAASPFIWEFLAGVGIGVLYRSELRIEHRHVLAALAIASIALVVVQQFSRFRTFHGITGFGPALVVMVLVLAMWHRASPLRVPRWLRWLGDLSFSLYLVHRIPQVGLGRLLPQEDTTLVLGIGFAIVTTVLGLVLAQLSYRYLERGLAETFRRWLVR